MTEDNTSTQIVQVLVTGARGSGKTLFLRSVTEDEVVSGEMEMDFAQVKVDDSLTMYLYGTLEVFPFDEGLFKALAQRLDLGEYFYGVVQVVDSTDPDSFPDCKALLHNMIASPDIPHVVVAATKQDQPGAKPPDEIRAALETPDDVPVVGCNAADPASAKYALRRLLYLTVEKILRERGV